VESIGGRFELLFGRYRLQLYAPTARTGVGHRSIIADCFGEREDRDCGWQQIDYIERGEVELCSPSGTVYVFVHCGATVYSFGSGLYSVEFVVEEPGGGCEIEAFIERESG